MFLACFARPALLALVLLAALAPLPAAAGGIIRDEEIERTLKTFATPVFEQAGLNPQDVTIAIINDDALNAFVAGGMNMFFHTGLLIEAKNAGEILGVMAHETGHIAAGHLVSTGEAIEDASRSIIFATLLGLAAAIGTGTPEAATAISTGGQSIALRRFLYHSRVQESAADQAAITFLKEADLPPDGILSFMQKLENQELLPENRQSEYVRTHPLTRDRVDFLKHAVAQSPRAGAALPDGWEERHGRMQAKLLGFLKPDQVHWRYPDSDQSIAARYARAIAAWRKNDVTGGLAQMEALLAAEPENPFFHELKGQMLLETGRVAEAVPSYRRAVALMPEAALIRIALAHALLETQAQDTTSAQQATREAIDHLNIALRTETRTASVHRLAATAFGRMGNDGMARLHLAEEAFLQRKFDDADRQIHLALQHLKKGSPGWLRAQDLLAQTEDAQKRQKKEK